MAFGPLESEFQKQMREMQKHMDRAVSGLYYDPINDCSRSPLRGAAQQPAQQAEAKQIAPAAPAKAAHLNNKLLLTVKG